MGAIAGLATITQPGGRDPSISATLPFIPAWLPTISPPMGLVQATDATLCATMTLCLSLEFPLFLPSARRRPSTIPHPIPLPSTTPITVQISLARRAATRRQHAASPSHRAGAPLQRDGRPLPVGGAQSEQTDVGAHLVAVGNYAPAIQHGFHELDAHVSEKHGLAVARDTIAREQIAPAIEQARQI